MTNAYRTIGILTLSLIIANCSKGKTPSGATDGTAAASATSINMLGVYDLNSVKQLQFESADTNGYRPAPRPQDVIKRILVLEMSGTTVANAGIYIKNAGGGECTGSVINFSSNDLARSLALAALGPNSHATIAPDAGYDRLSIFFRDGSSQVLPFDSMGAPINQNVILEGAGHPLNDLLNSVYDSGGCQPN